MSTEKIIYKTDGVNVFEFSDTKAQRTIESNGKQRKLKEITKKEADNLILKNLESSS